jgi:phage baseplate assembly protein W
MSNPHRYTYQLTPRAAPPPLPPSPIALISSNIYSPTVPAFLGSGLIHPFIRDQKNDFANDNGLNVIKSCVSEILGTFAADDSGVMQGELAWRPSFGSRIYLLKHKKGPLLIEASRHYATDALARWEPRVTNLRVTSAFFPSQLALYIDLIYDVISKNVPGNQVIFQGVAQRVGVPMQAAA